LGAQEARGRGLASYESKADSIELSEGAMVTHDLKFVSQ
jgi:hypothetical protein